jgi:hypothetical protein
MVVEQLHGKMYFLKQLFNERERERERGEREREVNYVIERHA